MDQESRDYIRNHFHPFLTENETLAMRHYHAVLDMENAETQERKEYVKKLHIRAGRFTEKPEVLLLLNDGYETFEKKVIQRIIDENPVEKIFNYCPRCGRLARTPKAKQCRQCRHSWRDTEINKHG